LFPRDFGFIVILEETLCTQSLGQTAGTGSLLTAFPTAYKPAGSTHSATWKRVALVWWKKESKTL